MHETLHPDIKGFLDELVINENGVYVRGWTFHNEIPLLALRVSGKSSNEFVIVAERQDVNQYYNKFDMILCGWSCQYPKNETIWLEALLDQDWIKIFKLYTADEPLIPELNNKVCSFIVVDNFYKNPDEVREFALQQEFIEHKEYHKGKRTDKLFKFPGLKEKFENLLGKKIRNWDTHGTNGCFQYCSNFYKQFHLAEFLHL